MIPEDIRQRVEDDFGVEQAEEIYEYLLKKVPEGLPNGTRPRHLRCVLWLANGDRNKLNQFIEMCLTDPRDVMLNAEYVEGPRGGLRQVRDFNQPFGQAEIGRKRRQ